MLLRSLAPQLRQLLRQCLGNASTGEPTHAAMFRTQQGRTPLLALAASFTLQAAFSVSQTYSSSARQTRPRPNVTFPGNKVRYVAVTILYEARSIVKFFGIHRSLHTNDSMLPHRERSLISCPALFHRSQAPPNPWISPARTPQQQLLPSRR